MPTCNLGRTLSVRSSVFAMPTSDSLDPFRAGHSNTVYSTSCVGWRSWHKFAFVSVLFRNDAHLSQKLSSIFFCLFFVNFLCETKKDVSMLNIFTFDAFSVWHSLSHTVMGVTLLTFWLKTQEYSFN